MNRKHMSFKVSFINITNCLDPKIFFLMVKC